ncbi:MAG: PilW family protein [Desulfofustis sp.]|nr:PilW family protein [Desulfofustis sp.]
MISDCMNAAVFQLTGYTSATGNVIHDSGGTTTPGNATKDLGKPFPLGSEIVKMTTMSYLIRNNSAVIPSLYRVDSTGSAELVQGVERMQVRYGIDTDNDRQVDSYVTAAGAAADWNQVIAVRVALLLQSDTDPKLPADTATYDLDGDGVSDYDDPADERRMRRVFKATFALRNRVS